MTHRGVRLLATAAVLGGLGAVMAVDCAKAQVASGRVASPAQNRARDAQLRISQRQVLTLRVRVGNLVSERDIAKSQLREMEAHLPELRLLLGLPDDTPAERVLAEAIQWARLKTETDGALSTLQEQATGIRSASGRVQAEALITQAKADFESGDLEGAIEQLDRLKAERSSAPPGGEVWLTAVRAQVAVARQHRDFLRAEQLLTEAENSPGRKTSDVLLELRKDRAAIAYERGLYLGDNVALASATSLYQDGVLPLIDRNANPSAWIEAQLGLAGATALLGSRQGGDSLLITAVEAYRAVLTVLSRETEARQWGLAQIGLAEALTALGERRSGTDEYVEARDVLDLALQVLDPDQYPLEWASAQHQLGMAVYYMGERTEEPRYFEGAIRHFELALTKRTREQTPVDWAQSQSGIAVSLSALGVAHSQRRHLDRARDISQTVVRALPRSEFPLMWAVAQGNLGGVFLTTGFSRRSQDDVAAAVDLYRQSLEELDRHRDPLTWATLTGNLGYGLVRLGEWRRDRLMVNEGVAALVMAREERSLSQSPSDWASTTIVLAMAQHVRGQLTGDFAEFLAMRAEVATAGEIFNNNGNQKYAELTVTLQQLFDAAYRQSARQRK